MILFDKVRENAEALSQIGMHALEEARRAGVPVHYMEPAYCGKIIREYPDGRRELLSQVTGGEAIPIDPRS